MPLPTRRAGLIALGLAGLALLFWPELAGHQASRETWLGLGLALLGLLYIGMAERA